MESELAKTLRAMCQVIQLSDYIPRKAADRRGHPRAPGHYLCSRCGNSMRLLNQVNEALNCGCGAEMRPVEAK